jgi:hypothetical protein
LGKFYLKERISGSGIRGEGVVMADCELLQGCLFFNDKMANMPSTAEVIKLRYCRGDNAECARYMIFRALGRGKVPEGLFPNQVTEAVKIIEKG